jgi:hypothetical protein
VFDKRRIRKKGLLAQALVLSAGRHSNWSSNDYQKYDFVLQVRPEGLPPFQATLREQFSIMERKPAEAELVQVKYDPESLEVVFHLDGDPRFDLEAMQARTAQLRWETYNRQQQGFAPSGGPANSGQRIQALEQLARLRDTGAITPEEFERLKAGLLNGS